MTTENEHKPSLKDSITGLGQKIIGEIETIGGVLTGDVIRTRRECFGRNGWFAFGALPNAGDAEEIGVKADE